MSVIPDQLVELARQGRLIPFVGAGFSVSLGYPSWGDLLKSLCDATADAVDYDGVMASTNGDLLQAAEYLFLKHDEQIGPLRHHIEECFGRASVNPLTSGPHVELVNLGAGQIYTTNYDNAVEKTYATLGQNFSTVVLPKDVALADRDQTQIVKYHGDLAHERTLVLTESAYYRRLDFESPMDLKFRSDLLGKSVLFMGYSFRDINIRIIWFKLMEMMRDIPERDRHPSYILMLEPDPVLEDLYVAVGLRPVVLAEKGTLTNDEERSRAVGQFLFELSMLAETLPRAEAGVGVVARPFVSASALEALEAQLKRIAGGRTNGPSRTLAFMRAGGALRHDNPLVARVLTGEVPDSLRQKWRTVVTRLLPLLPLNESTVGLVAELAPSTKVTEFVVDALASGHAPSSRDPKQALLDRPDIWPDVWSRKIDGEHAQRVLDAFRQELVYQAYQGADGDIAYLAELATRIANGSLVKGAESNKLAQEASELLAAAARIYSSIESIEPQANAAPDVRELLAQTKARSKAFVPVDLTIGQGAVARRTASNPRSRPNRPL